MEAAGKLQSDTESRALTAAIADGCRCGKIEPFGADGDVAAGFDGFAGFHLDPTDTDVDPLHLLVAKMTIQVLPGNPHLAMKRISWILAVFLQPGFRFTRCGTSHISVIRSFLLYNEGSRFLESAGVM